LTCAGSYEVILGSRDPAKGERVAPSGVRVAQLDVADAASVERLAGELERVDIVINNAAILYDTWAHARDADLAQVQAPARRRTLSARRR
jgi:NAD(P)-dependent dehydrogenase (short-subunit alcohol dehydrogenase family)